MKNIFYVLTPNPLKGALPLNPLKGNFTVVKLFRPMHLKAPFRGLGVISIFLFAQYAVGQTGWKAELPAVEKSDYYNVELNQELIGAGLKYLKISDERNNETPYFIRSADPVQEISSFESYDLKSNTTKDSLNIIIVDNAAREDLNRFCVLLQQAETNKYAQIRGSNNLKQWYIVKQQTRLSEFARQSEDNTEMLIVDFPQGNYRYYEITLWNDQKSPLEALKVGKIKNSNIYGNFVAIDCGKLSLENDLKNKNTRLSFPELNHPFCVNKIAFFIKNKPDYYRLAVITDSISYNQESFYLSSGNENTFLLNDFVFTPQTLISIENRNNPPLAVDSVKLSGLCRYACIYLEAGKKYYLLLNNKQPAAQEYDIEHFRNQIPADIPVVKPVNLQFVPEKIPPKRQPFLLERPAFLWSVIIAVGAFLVLICVRMIKDLKKRQNGG